MFRFVDVVIVITF